MERLRLALIELRELFRELKEEFERSGSTSGSQ